jgi:hypothetical protein
MGSTMAAGVFCLKKLEADPMLTKIKLPFRCMKRSRHETLVNEHVVAEALVELHTNPLTNDGSYRAECIIFSMDRALQLHALLSSYFDNVQEPLPVHVLYRTSSPMHQKAYEEVFAIFQERRITAVVQESTESFKKQLIQILGFLESSKVLFLVDDIIFIENVDIHDFAKFDTRTTIPSLRMGANLKRAYTVQQNQLLPPFLPQAIKDQDKLCWVWADGEYDWGYPLSVDGHLFSTQEISILANHTNFHSPNTFEDNLQAWAKYYKTRYGICYKKSRIVNIPANRVQNDINNIHGSVHQDYLLEQWLLGMQLDYRTLYGMKNISAHQEIELHLIRR